MYSPARDPQAAFDVHRRFEDMLARPLYRKILPHRNQADPARRLRVGYLSSDLYSHPVARNLLPVIHGHDRAHVELYFYAEVDRPDTVTKVFQSLADGWRSTVGLDDEQVATLIRDDGIDILVCLAGRLDKNRPLVCAYKPAPIQISFHDAATSGLSVIDYLFSDRVLTPRNTTERFSERLLCLPNFYVAEIPGDLPPIEPRHGPVVFGCLNNPSKITDDVLDLWGELLAATPDSRLLLRYKNLYETAGIRARVQSVLDRHGIAPARVSFPSAGMTTAEHLTLYNEIDIALDPFPYSGSTTTFEALLMGVPVVTLRGGTMLSLTSAAMLTSLKLTDLIAERREDYLAIARNLAADTSRRASLRTGLRALVARSALCDGAKKARQIERFFRVAWKRWCASRVPSESPGV